MQDNFQEEDASHNPELHFKGIVIGLHIQDPPKESCMIICSAVKDRHGVEPIILEIYFPASMRDDKPKLVCGLLVEGRGNLKYLYDGFFILGNLEILRTLPRDSPTDFDDRPWKSGHFPGQASNVLRKALRKMNVLDPKLPWIFLSQYANCTAFAHLLASTFANHHISLVSMNCLAMTIKSMPQKYCVIQRKHQHTYFCLLRGSSTLTPGYPFLAVGSFNIFPRMYEHCGSLCYLSNMEITGIQGDWGDIIFFRTALAQNIVEVNKLVISEQFYDNLLDLQAGIPLFWHAVFPMCSPPAALSGAIRKLEQLIAGQDTPVQPKIHGWWHDWGFWSTTLDENSTGIPGLTIIFYDGLGMIPNRLFIMPSDYESRLFPIHGCSVKISENPKILEGSYRPDETLWKMVSRWVAIHAKTLSRSGLGIDALYDLHI